MYEVNYTLATLNEDSCTQMTTQNSSQQSITINNNTILESTKGPNSSIIASRANTNSQKSQSAPAKTELTKNNKYVCYLLIVKT